MVNQKKKAIYFRSYPVTCFHETDPDHARRLIKKCMKENLHLPLRLRTSLYRVFDNDGYNIHAREAEFFTYFKNALSKTHKYSIYKRPIK